MKKTLSLADKGKIAGDPNLNKLFKFKKTNDLHKNWINLSPMWELKKYNKVKN